MSSKLSKLGIPSSFKLFAHTVTVKEVPNIPGLDKYADWDSSLNEIRVFTKGACDDVIVHSFYHELTHALLERAGQLEWTKDEVTVDVIGGLLFQYVATQDTTS